MQYKIARILQNNLALMLIAAVYCVLAALYAVNMPRWNAPDEPAHFNYIRDLAERGEFPILEDSDYDFAYLEKLKSARFPAGMSIDRLGYEAHQPPLYYLLGAAIYRIATPLGADAQILVLRLLSVLLGLLLILAGYATAKRLFPLDAVIPFLAAALLAFIPMHLATNAIIGNDALANLLLSLIVFEAIGLCSSQEIGKRVSRLQTLRLGLLLGAALLTKTTAYVGVFVVALAILIASRRLREPVSFIRHLALSYFVALLVAGWWFVRNMTVYGPTDPLGLAKHNSTMLAGGQPLTGNLSPSAFIAVLKTAFQSFWGQFGWMGVVMDERVYTALGGLTLAALLGLGLFLISGDCWRKLERSQKDSLVVLLVTFLLVAAAMAQYNLTFLQPQGRYLFPSIVAIAIGLAIGLKALVLPKHDRYVLGFLALSLALLDWHALFAWIVPALR